MGRIALARSTWRRRDLAANIRNVFCAYAKIRTWPPCPECCYSWTAALMLGGAPLVPVAQGRAGQVVPPASAGRLSVTYRLPPPRCWRRSLPPQTRFASDQPRPPRSARIGRRSPRGRRRIVGPCPDTDSIVARRETLPTQTPRRSHGPPRSRPERRPRRQRSAI